MPRHEVRLRPFALTNRLVTSREWIEFILAGGYDDPSHWLSDGWDTVTANRWRAPLYWETLEPASAGTGPLAMTLSGERELDLDALVCHVSFFEADAFARWAGHRLPTEFEWEAAASALAVEGHFVESGLWTPAAAGSEAGLQQMFGDAWEWTSSPYIGYPGFRPAPGAVGEYNGKFINGQYVLRGRGVRLSPEAPTRELPELLSALAPLAVQRTQVGGRSIASDAWPALKT